MTAEETTPTVLLDIKNMSCASCVARVEKALREVDGVEDASVNLASNTATVKATVPVETLIAAVGRIGYKAHLAAGRPTKSPGGKKELIDFVVALVLAIPLTMIHFFGIDFENAGYVQMLLAALILAVPGRSFFVRAVALLRHRQANMDTLVATGAFTAFAYSAICVLLEVSAGHLLFATAAMIVTLILLGRFLEAKAKARASGAIRELIGLQPPVAWLRRGEEWVQVPVAEIAPDDILLVKPGGKVPTDGVIVEGHASVDESMITGESMPVGKHAGDKVIGATINRANSFIMRAGKVGHDTVLAHIVRMVEQAQNSRSPVQGLADKVAGIFVPVVVSLALLTFVLWMAIDHDIENSIKAAVAVLVVACPCAMGLATPTAIMVGTGVAAKLGILVKDAESLENAHKIESLVFDKTGTVTQGRPEVTAVKAMPEFPEDEMLAAVAACESQSEHPIAQAVLVEALRRSLKIVDVENFESSTGNGIGGKVGEAKVAVGTRTFVIKNGVDVDRLDHTAEEIETEGGTAIYVGIGGRPAGVIGLSDPIRESSLQALAELRAMGIRTILASGDNLVTTRSVGKQTGILQAYGAMRPDDKIELIEKEKEEGRIVGMVGDGINDAPALAAANVGFAMGGGTDVAMESASITLVKGNIAKVATAIRLSRSTMRTIRQNLFWAFAYNTVAIPIAAFGKLDPMIAAGAMALSSVSVVANSLRLRRFAKKQHSSD